MIQKIAVIGFVFFVLGCSANKSQINILEIQNEVKKTSIVVVEKSIKNNSTSMEEIVSYLASDALKGRDTGSDGIDMAAKYIAQFFRTNNIDSYYDNYRDVFDVKGEEAFNIIGVLKGTDSILREEYVVIGAHYDHIGKGKKIGDDVIANGANDNAAGTAAVMQMARYFSKFNTNKRSVLFVLFAAEEKGLLGSKHLAKQMKKDNKKIYAMLNFEMIGVPLDKEYLAYVTGYHKSNLAEKMNAYANANLVGYLPQAKEYQLFSRSDNYPFYQEFNVPAQTFCTFDFTNFDYYHHVDDEVDKLDFKHMENFIKSYLPAIEKVVNSTPNEIKLND